MNEGTTLQDNLGWFCAQFSLSDNLTR